MTTSGVDEGNTRVQFQKVKDVDNPKKGAHLYYMQAATQQVGKMRPLPEPKMQDFKIAEAILDNLEDLINIPPVNWQPEPIADISATINGTHIEATIH